MAPGNLRDFLFALKQDGSLWGVGSNFGQFGDGSSNRKRNFEKLISSGVKAVSAGTYHSMVLKEDGTLWAAGRNKYGQLGDGTTTTRYTFVKVASGVKAVDAGEYQTLIVKQDGSLWSTGNNQYGELGDGTKHDRHTFVKVVSGGVKTVAAGADQSLIIKQDGSVWGTGYGGYCLLGHGGKSSLKFIKLMSSGATAVATGRYVSLVLKTDGTVWGAGGNGAAELGYWCSPAAKRTNTCWACTFRKVISGVKAVSASKRQTVVLKKDGSMWITGYFGTVSGAHTKEGSDHFVRVPTITMTSVSTTTPTSTTTTTTITCDGSKIDWADHTAERQSASTAYEAPGQRLGSILVFPCRQGYRLGTVTYTCGADGTFRTKDT